MSCLRCLYLKVLIVIACTTLSDAASPNGFNESAVVEKLLATDPRDRIDCLEIGLEDLLLQRGYNLTLREQEETFCRIRNVPPVPKYLWNVVTGAFCIRHTPIQRFKNRNFTATLLFTCSYLSPNGINYNVDLTVVDKTIVFFDYTNQGELALIQRIFTPNHAEAHLRRFIECAEEADDCCSFHMNSENIALTEENSCPATWDGWSCFPASQPGAIERVRCPRHSFSVLLPCIEYSERYCLEEGGWNQITNHRVCTAAPMVRRRLTFYIYALIVSTVLCLPALILFFLMRKISLSLILHRNLLVAIIVKNILTIMSNWIVMWENVDPNRTTNDSILERSPGGCKFLAYLENLSLNFIFTWMLMEAYYLHKTVVRVFSKNPICHLPISNYVFVIVSSIIPSTVWAILMASAGREECWMVDTETWYQWITDGYRLAILIINTLLLFDIIRVLIFKISQHTNWNEIKSAIKVILFLTLLFGVPLLILGQEGIMDTTYCTSAMIYFFVMYTIEALQGVLIAILFCYMSKEVHNQLRLKWNRLCLACCGLHYTSRGSTSRTVLTKDHLSSSFGRESVNVANH